MLRSILVILIMVAASAATQERLFNYPPVLSGGGVSMPGSSGSLLYNLAGSMAGAAGLTTAGNNLAINATSSSLVAGALLISDSTNTGLGGGLMVTSNGASHFTISTLGATTTFRGIGSSMSLRMADMNNAANFYLQSTGLRIGPSADASSIISGLTLEVMGPTTVPNVSTSSIMLRPGSTGAAPYTCAAGVKGAIALASNSLPMFCNGSTWTNAIGSAAAW